jgi:hypothetical protein
LPNHKQHGRGFLYRALKTEPGGERDAAGRLQRNIAQIDGYHAEAAALQQEVGDAQGLLNLSFFGGESPVRFRMVVSSEARNPCPRW